MLRRFRNAPKGYMFMGIPVFGAMCRSSQAEQYDERIAGELFARSIAKAVGGLHENQGR